MKTYSAGANGVIFNAMNTTANIIDTLQKNFGDSANISYKEIFRQTQLRETQNELMTTEMTMLEYQAYIWCEIDSIPFHASRPFDEQAITISDKCWERMKNDLDYETRMLDIIRDGRLTADPFFGMGSFGTYSILNFDGGEGCQSNMFSKNFGGSTETASKRFDNESENCFWTNRRKKRQQLLEINEMIHRFKEAQQEFNDKKALAAKLQARGNYDEAGAVLSSGVPASFLLAGLMPSGVSV